MIRLIATDLDGTLLTSGGGVSARTLAALEAAAGLGVLVVPASGRQPFSIADVLAGTFLVEGTVLGANGAVATHLGTGEVYFESLLTVEAQTELYGRLRETFPGIRCVSVRDGGATFVPQRGYVGMMDPGDHGRPEGLPEFDLADVLGTPSVKMVIRDPEVSIDELLAAALDLEVPGCSLTTSGAPFLEVGPAGVHKGTGLARLCGVLGIDRSEVVAFGDNRNDAEMLAWAGLGVAMAGGLPEAIDVADEVTASNDEDGIALVVERLLGGIREAGPARLQ